MNPHKTGNTHTHTPVPNPSPSHSFNSEAAVSIGHRAERPTGRPNMRNKIPHSSSVDPGQRQSTNKHCCQSCQPLSQCPPNTSVSTCRTNVLRHERRALFFTWGPFSLEQMAVPHDWHLFQISDNFQGEMSFHTGIIVGFWCKCQQCFCTVVKKKAKTLKAMEFPYLEHFIVYGKAWSLSRWEVRCRLAMGHSASACLIWALRWPFLQGAPVCLSKTMLAHAKTYKTRFRSTMANNWDIKAKILNFSRRTGAPKLKFQVAEENI